MTMTNAKVKGINEPYCLNVLVPKLIKFLKLNGILWIITTLVGLVHQRLRRREAMVFRRHSVDSTYVSSTHRGRSRLGESEQDLEFDTSMSSLYPRCPPTTIWKERISTRYSDTWARDSRPPIDVPLKAVHHGRSAGTLAHQCYDRFGEMAVKGDDNPRFHHIFLPPTRTSSHYI